MALKPLDRRFIAALACYLVLAVPAGLTLEGGLRAAVWALLAALAVKTWAAWRAERRGPD